MVFQWSRMLSGKRIRPLLRPVTQRLFKGVERVKAIDPETASIYRDTLLAEEARHEWLAQNS